ncbi:MAG: SUF system NifU family Fe-S cluster assembly protein [SAR202 cluster bacterium]|nr:SUF system NifU family Fe-S cluster assembly protein [SAR202 cluster bacterium]
MPDGLDDLYQEIILDHYRHPRNKGLLADADLQAEGYNPFCGDQVRLTMDLDESGHVHKVGFDGQGCSISQASASILTKLVKGRSVDEVQGLVATVRRIMQGADMTDEQKDELGELEALEGVKKFPIRVKCALLPWTTLQDAVSEYRKTHAQ